MLVKTMFLLVSILTAVGLAGALPAPDSKQPEDVSSEEIITDLEPQDNFAHEVERRAVSTNSCLRTLYIMAFTSGVRHAGSDTRHNIEIVIRNSRNSIEPRHLRLYDRPGNDMLSNKGDLWTIRFSSFHFSDSCIYLRQIQSVSITEDGNDGWNIHSIVTLVQDSRGGVQLLTQNLNVGRWIDGDGHHSHRQFQLNMSHLRLG